MKIIAFSKAAIDEKELFLKFCSIILSTILFQNPQKS